MATLLSLGAAAIDSNFQSRVKVALVRRALLVLGETINGMTQKQTDKRQELAASILRTTAPPVLTWAAAIVTTLDNTAPADADIETTIANIWDDMAGCTTLDKTP